MFLSSRAMARRPRKGLSDESRQAFLDCSSRLWWKGLLCPEHRPYPYGTFNPERQWHRIEEAFGGAMTFPTELSHPGLRDQELGLDTTGLATPIRVRTGCKPPDYIRGFMTI